MMSAAGKEGKMSEGVGGPFPLNIRFLKTQNRKDKKENKKAC